jgi:hypothetical protein
MVTEFDDLKNLGLIVQDGIPTVENTGIGATPITVIRIMATVILARPPPRRFKQRWHDGATITVRLTV